MEILLVPLAIDDDVLESLAGLFLEDFDTPAPPSAEANESTAIMDSQNGGACHSDILDFVHWLEYLGFTDTQKYLTIFDMSNATFAVDEIDMIIDVLTAYKAKLLRTEEVKRPF